MRPTISILLLTLLLHSGVFAIEYPAPRTPPPTPTQWPSTRHRQRHPPQSQVSNAQFYNGQSSPDRYPYVQNDATPNQQYDRTSNQQYGGVGNQQFGSNQQYRSYPNQQNSGTRQYQQHGNDPYQQSGNLNQPARTDPTKNGWTTTSPRPQFAQPISNQHNGYQGNGQYGQNFNLNGNSNNYKPTPAWLETRTAARNDNITESEDYLRLNATDNSSDNRETLPADIYKTSEENIPSSLGSVGSIVSNSYDSITFITSNKTAEPVPLSLHSNNDGLIITGRSEYSKNNCSELLQMSSVPNNTTPSFGFIQSVTFAYKNHHNLVLRPDDIWTAIMVQFSMYINKHSEKYRSRLVTHTGRKELVVKLSTGGLRSLNYNAFITKMNQLILDTVKPEKAAWILPDFSTTTPQDKIVGGILLMAQMQKYFDYKFEIGCGIPQITLLGTAEDWRMILRRTKRFENFGPEMIVWRKMLKPILQRFVDAKHGIIDKSFWSDICRISANYIGKEDAILDGWVTAFSVFDNDGNWQGGVEDGQQWPKIDMENWAPGIVTVPVVIEENRGPTHDAILMAGHMGQTTLKDDHTTLQPYSGWGIALK